MSSLLFVGTGFCSLASLLPSVVSSALLRITAVVTNNQLATCYFRRFGEINPPIRDFHPLEISHTCYSTIKKICIFDSFQQLTTSVMGQMKKNLTGVNYIVNFAK